MSTTTVMPGAGTVTVTVSGPSTVLTMLHTLWAKLAHGAQTVYRGIRHALSVAVRLPRAIADIALGALSTDTGYAALTGAIGRGLRAVGGLLSRGLRWLGRTAASLARKAATVVDAVIPGTGAHLTRLVDRAQAGVTAVFDRITQVASGVADVCVVLVNSPLVRTVTTRLAAGFSALLAVHVLTQGALATRLVQAVPSTVQLVAWATNPWMLLAGLGVGFGIVMGIAAVRLWQASSPQTDGPDTPTGSDGQFEDIVSRLRVVISPDGSVHVEGIPADLPEADQQGLAASAAQAAVSRLDRLVRRGRPLTSADRRSATKAAQAAARAWLTCPQTATA